MKTSSIQISASKSNLTKIFQLFKCIEHLSRTNKEREITLKLGSQDRIEFIFPEELREGVNLIEKIVIQKDGNFDKITLE